MHKRIEIRAKILELLNDSGLFSSVYSGRVKPVNMGSLPAALIFTNSEASEQISLTSTQKMLSLTVEILVKGTEDDLDQLLNGLEEIWSNNTSLDEIALDLALNSTEFELIDEKAQILSGQHSINIEYIVNN